MAIVAYTSYMYYKALMNMKKKKKQLTKGPNGAISRRLDPFSSS